MMRRKAMLVGGEMAALSLVVLGACATGEVEPVLLQEVSMGIQLTSAAFSERAPIPTR